MASGGPRASSSGVSSLRAMFESQRSSSESPDRGRAPLGSSNGENGRKLSRVRSSFVTVDSGAQLVKTTSTTSDSPPEVSAANREGRESFYMDKADDAEVVERNNTISQEEERRKSRHDIQEAAPEVAIETGPAGFGTPVLNPTDKKLDIMRKVNTPGQIRENLKRNPPSASKLSPESDSQESTPLPPAEVLQNLANNLRKPSQPLPRPVANGKAPAIPAVEQHDIATPKSEPFVAPGEVKAPATPSTTGRESHGTPPAVVTSTGDLQTSPGGVSPTVPRRPLVPPDDILPEHSVHPTQAEPPRPEPGAKQAPLPSGAKRTPATGLRPIKSPRPSRSTPNFKGSVTGNKNANINRKPPTVPVAPVFSSSTRERDVSNRPSNASTSTTSATTSGTGFHKPRPKSPTRPLKLPSHLLAPTASSAAKKHCDQAPPSPTVSSIRDRSRRPSTISERGTKPTLSTPQLGRKPSVRPQGLKSSVGPPPRKRVEVEQNQKKETKVPDHGFLARMMRPTASSASKAREHRELEMQQKRQKQRKPTKTGTLATASAVAADNTEAVEAASPDASNGDCSTVAAAEDANILPKS